MNKYNIQYQAHGRAKCNSDSFGVTVHFFVESYGNSTQEARDNGLPEALNLAKIKLFNKAREKCFNPILEYGYISHRGKQEKIDI